MNIKLLSAFFCVACMVLAGCEEADRPPPAHVDASTPMSAAVAYLVAIQRADGRTARALAIGTPDQKRWVDALVAMVDGMRSFDKALYARFGRSIDQVHVEIEDGIRALADRPVEAIANGAVTSNQDKARIDPRLSGFATRQITSVYLTNGKYGWRVDLGKTYAEDVAPGKLPEISAVFAEYQKFGEAFHAVANEIVARRYHSSDEATRALGERIKAIAEAHKDQSP